MLHPADITDEKKTAIVKTTAIAAYDSTDELSFDHNEADLNVTDIDLLQAKEFAKDLSLEDVRSIMEKVLKVHENDPNFPISVIEKIHTFLGNEDVFENPENHTALINEIKKEAALITNNSPYAEVRSVVDNTDDVTMPSSTIRAWVIGLFFVTVSAFISQLFSIRQPTIGLGTNVAQLLAYPIGKAAEAVLPDWGFTLFGSRHSLNPGKFSRKEHMLITIMANVGGRVPYTDNIIWTQFLPQYFNQSYAGHFSYQILIGLGTNFIGYGIAGLCRKFLIYPTYCVWPASLVTIALSSAFHNDTNVAVPGPFKRIFTVSRLKFFCIAFAAMFVYFWFPDYIFQALSIFNWMTWIAPNNVNLNAVVGMTNGLGLNPLPTFDWNILLAIGQDPLMIPFFSTFNSFLGMFFSMFLILGLWYSNAYNAGHLPINSNRVFDNTGGLYNVSRVTNKNGLFDAEKYESYSQAYMSASIMTVYVSFFAIYAAMISYSYLYHRQQIMMGFRSLFSRFLKKDESAEYKDVHNKLMAAYPEVPESWYMICLVAAVVLSCAGIAGFQTFTTVGVVFYGIALCLLFVVPVGIIKAITGVEVSLTVLAEFIGGSWAAGNALAMNYFKSFGFVTCAHAISFSNDLKLGHYVKVPPRHTFLAQMIATLVSTFVCTGVLNFQMKHIPKVCTIGQVDHFTCPAINSFFTAAVFWGTIGPRRIFGTGGQYTALLVGFPIGFVLPFCFWYAQRRWKNQTWLRQAHPVIMMRGASSWAPYNLSYVWPAVPLAWLSMVYMKRRYLALWSKYNYVLSASFTAAIAIAALIIFFAFQLNDIKIEWWGNTISSQGCEKRACTHLKLAKGENFGPSVGEFH